LFLDHLSLIEYAETDTLTGLLNRKTFDENLNRILANVGNDDTLLEQHPYPHRRHARKAGVSNWLAVADIDHFKRINDTHGHIIGDEVLLLVAQFMRQSFRFDDQLFRFGGEEFVTVLQPAGQGDAFTVLERFRTKIETHDFPIVGQLTISIGFTRIDALDSPTELVGRADQALYFAKQSGRNRVESYEDLLAAGLIVDNLPHKTDIELF
jgi:diguanylate cyclase (GGDEF)-like protein